MAGTHSIFSIYFKMLRPGTISFTKLG